MILNGDILRARRLELGISRRALAKLCGITGETITRLEETGNPAQLSVETLMKLLRNLAVDLNDVTVESSKRQSNGNIATTSELGQLLHGHGKAMPKSQISDCLGLTMTEVDSALLQLDESLRLAGLRIHHASTGVAIIATAKSLHSDKAREAAQRTRSFSVLNAGDLSLLYRIMKDGLDHNVIARRNNGNVSLHKLENADLIHIEKGGRLRLSDRALSALGAR